LEEIREIIISRDLSLLKSFLQDDPIKFLPLLFCLKENCFHQAYVGIREGSIKTLVTTEEDSLGDIWTIWPGDVKYVKPILEQWGSSHCHMSVGVKHLHSILKIYKPTRVFDEIFIMYVDKKHFNFKPTHTPEKLNVEELPKPWTKHFMGIAYGISVDNKIVSVGSVDKIVDGVGAYSAAIKTDSEYQNKGYATSTLAYAVSDVLKSVPVVTYYVESTNRSTLRVLEKLGFRFHSAFLYTDVEKK